MDAYTALFKHHIWANQRIVELCMDLTADELGTSLTGTRGSVGETLWHLIDAECDYVTLLTGQSPVASLDDLPTASFTELHTLFQQTGETLLAYAPTIRPGQTTRAQMDHGPEDVPSALILAQAIAHAGEHREQIKAMLTDLGKNVPDLSTWAYYFVTKQTYENSK